MVIYVNARSYHAIMTNTNIISAGYDTVKIQKYVVADDQISIFTRYMGIRPIRKSLAY